MLLNQSSDSNFPCDAYTSSVVLWMLVFQRIRHDSTLEAAVKKLIDSRPSFLPRNKRLRENKLSTATGAYSQARGRLPLEAARALAAHVSQSLIDAAPPSFEGRRVFLVDGTTLTLAPTPELRRAFPPGSNQHGENVWPVALLVLTHELSSGAATLPEIGPMYGPEAVSETALCRGVFARLPQDGIVMADAGYGIFSVAHEVQQSGRDFVFRMADYRFKSLLKRGAKLVAQGPKWKTWTLRWTPSDKDLKTNEFPPGAAVEIRLHQIRVSPHLTLHLATTLPQAALKLAALYKLRVNIEVDIRNVKVVLNTETIEARGVDMFQKELLASFVSYNLVTQFRRQTAALAQVPPRAMSFKRTWTTFRTFLLGQMYTDAKQWYERFRQALRIGKQDKLPRRPGRSYPRAAYPRRPKSNHFEKRKPPPALPRVEKHSPSEIAHPTPPGLANVN